MHRRGLQCLTELPASRTLLRQYQTATGTGNARPAPTRPKKTSPKAKPKIGHIEWSWGSSEDKRPPEKFTPAKGASNKRPGQKPRLDTTNFTKKLVKVSTRNVTKPGWKVGDQQDALRAKVVSKAPSEEKQQFMAANPDLEASDSYTSHEVVRRGTFVELRRSAVTIHAVIMHASVVKGITVVHSMTTRGEMIDHSATDIMFSIPWFIDEATVVRCGGEEAVEDVEEQLTEHKIAALVDVLKRITELEKKLEECYHDISLSAARVVQRLPVVRDNWTHVSTAAVARQVCGRRVVPAAALFAIHKFLMDKPKEYVAPAAYLTTQTFAVRPRSEIENIDLVSSMIGRRDPRVEVFLEKARKIISTAESEESTSTDSHTLATAVSTVTFTEDEQAIIRFLKDYVRPTRTIQKNPYLVPVATLIRWLNLYPEEQVNASLVHSFLTRIGVLAPWDESSVTTSRHEVLALRPLPDSEIHAPPVLRPDETYPQDLLVDLRHDFGDMPVYVIDDAYAEELDDGISVETDSTNPENHWIHVHVADPTSVIHPTHNVTKDARQLMVTHYLLQGTIPMIPPSLTFEGLSLGSGKSSQNVLTFSMKVDGDGVIVDYAVRAGLIRNVRTILYDQVDEILGTSRIPRTYPFGSPAPPPVRAFVPDSLHSDNLHLLNKVTDRLLQRSVEDGILMLYANKLDIALKDGAQLPVVSDPSRPYRFHGFPNVTYAVDSGRLRGARQLVSECMKGAARVASRFFRDHNLPAIRRAAGPVVTDKPETTELLLSKRDANGYIGFGELWKTNAVFPTAQYTLDDKGHAQLGVPDGEGYVRITSPLRRFGDMVHHWQIKYALLGYKQPCFSAAWLANFATEMGLKEAAVAKASVRQTHFWAFNFIKQYMEDPKCVSERNPLHNVKVLASQDAYIDRMNGRSQVRIMIPSLGVSARAYDVPLEMQAGDIFKADYWQVQLGSDPVLLVTYRGV